jgi:hypothetical protein
MKANINSLPNPPADVLALLDRIPPDALANIQLQLVFYNGGELIKLGREPTDEEFYKLLLSNGEEYCRLIRETAVELGINAKC